MKQKEIVSIIMPTVDNQSMAYNCIQSILKSRTSEQLFHIYVINNGGSPGSCDWIDPKHKFITLINLDKNTGWEGAITEGIKHSKGEFILFMNDDTIVPISEKQWLNKMLQHFRDPKVAAVGPSSNMVMGFQNMLALTDTDVFTAKFLIGFCVLLRRSAFEEIGGMDFLLPGGDDFDWSIRFRDAGYKLIVDKNIFIFHYGGQTGMKLYGDHTVSGGWNSPKYTEKVDTALIKKHGFNKWWEIRESAIRPPNLEYGFKKDSEGTLIREKVQPKGLKIVDIGCGNLKTFDDSIGVDIVKKGDIIAQIGGDSGSAADVQADVSKPLPFEEASFDVGVARHVLEHMLDPIDAMRNWLKIIKPGGKLVISLPNEYLIRSIPMNPEHMHAWTPETFINFLNTVGGMKILEMWDSENNISFTTIVEKI